MLCLARRRNQRIRIGEDIWLTVISTGRSTVRLGIDAPRGCNILREELIGKPFSPAFDAAVELPDPVVV